MPFTRSIDGITHEYVVNISWTQWVSKEKKSTQLRVGGKVGMDLVRAREGMGENAIKIQRIKFSKN